MKKKIIILIITIALLVGAVGVTVFALESQVTDNVEKNTQEQEIKNNDESKNQAIEPSDSNGDSQDQNVENPENGSEISSESNTAPKPEYDEKGRLTKDITTDSYGRVLETVYVYDGDNLVKETCTQGGLELYRDEYTYDENGKMATKSHVAYDAKYGTIRTDSTYDGNTVLSVRYVNGVETLRYVATYDSEDRVISSRTYVDGKETEGMDFFYPEDGCIGVHHYLDGVKIFTIVENNNTGIYTNTTYHYDELTGALLSYEIQYESPYEKCVTRYFFADGTETTKEVLLDQNKISIP